MYFKIFVIGSIFQFFEKYSACEIDHITVLRTNISILLKYNIT